MNGKRFDFCDYVTEEEGAFFNRALAARSRAFLRALSGSETKQKSLMFREGCGVFIPHARNCSDMTSSAALWADMVRS